MNVKGSVPPDDESDSHTLLCRRSGVTSAIALKLGRGQVPSFTWRTETVHIQLHVPKYGFYRVYLACQLWDTVFELILYSHNVGNVDV